VKVVESFNTPLVAVIVAKPLDWAVTRPEASTVATAALLDDHVAVSAGPVTCFPIAVKKILFAVS